MPLSGTFSRNNPAHEINLMTQSGRMFDWLSSSTAKSSCRIWCSKEASKTLGVPAFETLALVLEPITWPEVWVILPVRGSMTLLLPRKHLQKPRIGNQPELASLHRVDGKKSDQCGCKHVRHPWAKVVEWSRQRITK